ncbi:MAG: glycosyltransferase [Terriglobales bacterium]|jgi:glycosyltransferase involved in cell wall biosynthesis
MRVLQVIDSLAVAGAEVLVANLAPRMRARGIDCGVAVLRTTSSPLEAALQTAGVPLLATGLEKVYSLRQVGPLAKLMDGYDLVHVHLFPAQLWAVLGNLRLRQRIPLVTTEHASTTFRHHWWLHALDAWMYRHYEIVVCNSDATVEALVQWCPGTASKVRMIHNGIPIEDFESASAADLPRNPDCQVRLAFVGRFDPPKDHETVLRALAELPGAELLLVGDGPLRTQSENLAQSLGVAARVRFLGRRSDIPQLLKAADIFVYSTDFEGFGIAACEAMSSGLPVVASDVSGLAQLVHGAGILFPARDHKALARALQNLMSSPEERTRMGQAARGTARRFSIEKTVDSYAELYESVLRKYFQ